ncbi:MAG: F0F1 ATP synthase subunit B [Candidatus Omnitrophica bacterium]|nr:F0F1 ATP synthase subunit B [Candidatus Omnitrophota bacterium]
MELLKLLNLNEIIVQIISFLILLFVLRIFAWKRILSILEQRRERIAAEFDLIEKAKAEAARLKSEYETHLKGLEDKSRECTNKAVEEGRKMADEMRKLAYAQSQDIISDARKNIAYELKKVHEEVKNKIVDLAIGAAEAVIREKLNGADDRKIVEEFIENIDKAE